MWFIYIKSLPTGTFFIYVEEYYGYYMDADIKLVILFVHWNENSKDEKEKLYNAFAFCT